MDNNLHYLVSYGVQMTKAPQHLEHPAHQLLMSPDHAISPRPMQGRTSESQPKGYGKKVVPTLFTIYFQLLQLCRTISDDGKVHQKELNPMVLR
jgi:hypothetical protein